MKNDQKGPPAANSGKFQIPSDLVVKSQVADIIDLILQLIGHPNGVHRPCRNRKSRGAVLSTSEGQWATTKFDGVWFFHVIILQDYPVYIGLDNRCGAWRLCWA